MPEQSELDRRLRAVERTLTDGDHDVAELQDAAAIDDRLTDVERRIKALEERVDELDAATQAVRGYVGNVRSVNDEVEARADAALAAVDRLEARLDDREKPERADRTVPSGRDRDVTHQEQDAATEALRGKHGSSDQYGIEMPPPGRNGSRSTEDEGDEDDEDRAIIDRVREVL